MQHNPNSKRPSAQLDRSVDEVPESLRALPYVFVTPEMASNFLANHNHRNRPIRRPYIRRLADTMLRDEWRGFNGDAYRFDEHGELIDGQHRFAAMVKSGMGQWCLMLTLRRGLRGDHWQCGASEHAPDAPQEHQRSERVPAPGFRLASECGSERGSLKTLFELVRFVVPRDPGHRLLLAWCRDVTGAIGRRESAWTRAPFWEAETLKLDKVARIHG